MVVGKLGSGCIRRKTGYKVLNYRSSYYIGLIRYLIGLI